MRWFRLLSWLGRPSRRRPGPLVRRYRPQLEILEDRCHPSIVTFLATLDGSHAVPSNMVTAMGTATVTLDTTTDRISVNAFVTGIRLADATQFHFHQGINGVQGPDLLDLLPFSQFVASGSGISFSASNIPFPSSAASQLLSGNVSLEVHTTQFGNGEIEGPVVPQPLLNTGQPIFATGADAGGSPEVRVFDARSGALKLDFFAFDPSFRGGVRVAVGDINGDGIPDVIAAAGPGGAPEVKVFSGQNGALLYDFFAYTPSFTGGVFVAAGDVNGDGVADIVTGTDAGAAPEVKVFGGGKLGGQQLRDFFAYSTAFTGGVRVAVGDVNGDGFGDIITGSGPGAPPEVKVFSGLGGTLLQDYFAFNPAFTGGVFVAARDVNGDGLADVVTGTGAGGLPEVKVFSGRGGTQLVDFFAYNPAFRGGVRVGAVDSNGDGRAALLTVPGTGGGPELKAFNGLTLQVIDDFFASNPGFLGGSFVGGH